MNNDDTFNSNSDNNLTPELEARVVAWVLGEASDFEAAELTRLCAEQPELAVFKRRIEAVHGLLGEATRPARHELPRLSPERRAKVLAVIGGASATADTDNETRALKRSRSTWRAWAVPMAACLALMLGVAGVLIPTVGSVRETARRSVALSDARQREQATMIMSMEAESGGMFVSRGDADLRPTVPIPPVMSPMPAPKPAAQPEPAAPSLSLTLDNEMPSAYVFRDADGFAPTLSVSSAPVAMSYDVLSDELYAGRPVSAADLQSGQALSGDSGTVSITAGTPQAFNYSAPIASARRLTTSEAAEIKKKLASGGVAYVSAVERLASSRPAEPGEGVVAPRYPRSYGVPIEEPVAVDAFAPSPPASDLLARGRSQYNDGDLEAAAQTFRALEAAQPANPDAKYFQARIAKDKAAVGELRRDQAGGFMVQEVASSWQRPSDVVGDKSEVSDRRRLEAVATEVRGHQTLRDANSKNSDSARKQLEDTIVPSLNFNGVPLSQAIASLNSVRSDYAPEDAEPLNIIVENTGDHDPKVSITLRNLSAKRMLDFVTTAVGYDYEIRGNTVFVRRAGGMSTLQTEFIPVSREALAKMLGREELAVDDAELLRKFFQQAGVDMSAVPGAAMTYDGAAVIVMQTSRNIERLKDIVRRYEEEVAKELLDTDLRAETVTAEQAVSTFSLHVSDASFRVAQAALARGVLPEASSIRPEEFYNAFDYGDPAPVAGEPVACRIEQAAHPFLQQRNLVRIAMKVPAAGRSAAQPLRLTVLLDTSGSMEREDRAATVRAALGALASLLGPADRVTLIGFARTPRLLAVNMPGDQAARLIEIAAQTPAEGGTNLEVALQLAGEQARAHRLPAAQNRIVLLTDGAANLGDADPARLSERVEALRREGIAFDACGVVADGLDDGVLEALTRKGDGRYAIINSPEEADANFARQLAGAFRPAAKDVKVQVRFNPARVARYRLIGFEQHRLRTEDFRDNKIDAAELAAEEAANALYQVEVLPEGEGELGEVFVRFLDPSSGFYVERSWVLGYDAQASAFARATPSLQLAGSAAFLAEKLRGGELAGQVRLDEFAPVVNGLGAAYPGAARVREFIEMFSQTRRVTGE